MTERKIFEAQRIEQQAERDAQPDWLPTARTIAQFLVGAFLAYVLLAGSISLLSNP